MAGSQYPDWNSRLNAVADHSLLGSTHGTVKSTAKNGTCSPCKHTPSSTASNWLVMCLRKPSAVTHTRAQLNASSTPRVVVIPHPSPSYHLVANWPWNCADLHTIGTATDVDASRDETTGSSCWRCRRRACPSQRCAQRWLPRWWLRTRQYRRMRCHHSARSRPHRPPAPHSQVHRHRHRAHHHTIGGYIQWHRCSPANSPRRKTIRFLARGRRCRRHNHPVVRCLRTRSRPHTR